MNRIPAAGRIVVAVLGAVLVLTACTGDKGEGGDVQAVAHADAKRWTADYAQRTAAALGEDAALQPGEDPVPVPCDGKPDGVYHVQGIYQILLPGEQHLDGLRRLRENWQQAGYEIRKERTFPAGKGGEISAVVPADSFAITVSSGQPPAMVVIVASPCYQSDEPL